MEKERCFKVVVGQVKPDIKQSVILNLIQNLQRGLLFKHGERGRSRIKYGMTSFFNNVKAFTLIELLVVVLIIAILAAVAVPQYKVAVVKSRLATIRPIMASIKQAEEAYYMANGAYSTVVTDWDLLGIDLSSCQHIEQYSDVMRCGHFMIDPIDGSGRNTLRAGYCPQSSNWGKVDSCDSSWDFVYTVWLDYSAYPGKIECSGRTDLGKRVCKSLKL